MSLLRLISYPYARKHLLRTLLTIAGIVLGITVYVGMNAANEAVLASFRNTVERIAGKADLQVSAGESGFDEDVLERVQSVEEVRVAVPVIEAVVGSGIAGQGNLLILAVDMTGDRSLRDYDFDGGDEEVVDDPLVFLAQPDSLIITRDFAQRNGLTSGSRVPMQTMEGEKTFVVRGIMRPGGMASAFGGNIAIMDIYAAQFVFGRGRKFDRIDLALKEGVGVQAGREKLQQILGPGFEVEPPSARGQYFASLLQVYTSGVSVSSWFAMFIGMFIIYNSFEIAVTQRRSEIGVLRALGATQRQIRTLFLLESASGGLIGSIIGLGLGALAARALARQVDALLESIYSVSANPSRVDIPLWLTASAILLGVATSVIAAWIPARDAARIDPVKALQKGRYQVLGSGENRIRAAIAVVSLIASVALLTLSGSRAWFYTGFVLIGLAAVLLAPAMVLWLTRAVRPLMRWISPVEGSLAADSLIQAPRRTSATVAALMLSLAMVVGLGGIARASYKSILNWMETTLNPDLYVSTSESLSARNFRFPPEMYGTLAKVEGVDEVQPVRTLKVRIDGVPIVLVSIELMKVGPRTHGRRPVAGDFAEMHRIAGAGEGLIISENFSQLRNLGMGDVVRIPSPSGIVALPVVGILTEYSGQQGTIIIDRSLYLKHWNDLSTDVFRLYLKPGEKAEQVKQRILERTGNNSRVFVLLNRDVRSFITSITDQWFGMTYLQAAIAVLVAMLGIVNTLTVSIADRRRELGVLRAVGGLRSQIRRTVWMEAVMIGVVGLVLGIAMGAVNLRYQLEMVKRDFSGMVLEYSFPWEMSLALVPVILLTAFVASIAPAENAVRSSLVEALEYE